MTEDNRFYLFFIIALCLLFFVFGIQAGKWDEQQRIKIQQQVGGK